MQAIYIRISLWKYLRIHKLISLSQEKDGNQKHEAPTTTRSDEGQCLQPYTRIKKFAFVIRTRGTRHKGATVPLWQDKPVEKYMS